MPRIVFEEVALTAAKTVNGKRRQKKFYQTLNPFNKNKNGVPKTRGEILDELRNQIEEWTNSND
jgi:hypothetical protein